MTPYCGVETPFAGCGTSPSSRECWTACLPVRPDRSSTSAASPARSSRWCRRANSGANSAWISWDPRISEYARARYATGFREFRHLHDLAGLETVQETFDCVTGIELIEHLTPAEVHSLLREVARKLVPGGRLVITTPNYASVRPLLEALLNRLSEVKYQEQHITRFNYFQIERQLAALYPDFGRQFSVELKTTTHLLTPFLAGLSFRAARFLSRLVPHNRWRLPFGNLVLLVARRKCESIGEMPRNAVSA